MAETLYSMTRQVTTEKESDKVYSKYYETETLSAPSQYKKEINYNSIDNMDIYYSDIDDGELKTLFEWHGSYYSHDGSEFHTLDIDEINYDNLVDHGIDDVSDIDDWDLFSGDLIVYTLTQESDFEDVLLEVEGEVASKTEYLISTDKDTWHGYDSDEEKWKIGYRMSKDELESLTEDIIYDLIDNNIYKEDFYYRVILNSNHPDNLPVLESIDTTFKENEGPVITDPEVSPVSFYTETHLTGTLRDLEGDVIDYRILIKRPSDDIFVTYSDWKSIESGYEIDEVIENDYFEPGENKIKIETYDQREEETDYETSVTMLNENPLILYTYNEFKVWGSIEDEYEDDVKWRLYINGELVKEYEDEYQPTPLEFEFNWEEASDVVEFESSNEATIEAEDEWGETESDNFVFQALPRGLFFTDKYGDRYSDADGVIKKLLDLPSVTAGRNPKSHYVNLKNYTGYSMDNMKIWTEYDEENENIEIMYDTNEDMSDPKKILSFNDVISPSDDRDFYVAAVTDVGEGESGYKFTIRARGDYIDR